MHLDEERAGAGEIVVAWEAWMAPWISYDIVVDGEDRSKLAYERPAQLFIPAGRHEVRLRHRKMQSRSVIIDVTAGGRTELFGAIRRMPPGLTPRESWRWSKKHSIWLGREANAPTPIEVFSATRMLIAVAAVVFFTFQAAGNLSRGRTFWLVVGIVFVLVALATVVREARMFWRARRSPTAKRRTSFQGTMPMNSAAPNGPKIMDATNLADLYGSPLLDWGRITDRLDRGVTQAPGTGGPNRHTCWLATINRDGSPHLNGIGAIWVDGAFWFETGETTRKGRNLARDPRCTLSVATEEFDVVVEGEARKVTDPPTVAAMAARWAAEGWPARVDETGSALTAEYSAPSAGPPPWFVYRLVPRAATALLTVEPGGATRWRF